ncbi:MAG: hypothetical protein AAFP90_05620 [Planctomycetota bacterium]
MATSSNHNSDQRENLTPPAAASDPTHRPSHPPSTTSETTEAPITSEGQAAPTPEQRVRRQIDVPELNPQQPYGIKCVLVKQAAESVFSQTGYWAVFYSHVLGVNGVVAKMFPSESERRRFETSEHFDELLAMLTAIRAADTSKIAKVDKQRMLTVRVPETLHETLRHECDQLDVAMNRLAISKLLLPIDPRLVPEETHRRRGRQYR